MISELEAAFWNHVAGSPDVETSYVCGEPQTTTSTVELIAMALPNRGTLVEIGTGLGRLATAMADEKPHAQIVGLDIAQKMLDRARRHPRVGYRLGDGRSIPLRPESVDGIWSVCVMQHLPIEAVKAYLDEAVRVLRPISPLVFQFAYGETYRGDFHYVYEVAQMWQMALDAGLKVEAVTVGTVQPTWAWLLAHKGDTL